MRTITFLNAKSKVNTIFGFTIDARADRHYNHFLAVGSNSEEFIDQNIISPEFAEDLIKCLHQELEHYRSDFYAWTKKRTGKV